MKKNIFHTITFFILITTCFFNPASADRSWGPNEKNAIRWFNNVLETKLRKLAPGASLIYISQMITLRIPWLLTHGGKLGGAYAAVVEDFGVGNCGDLAMYIAKTYPKSFQGKIIVLRAQKTLLGMKQVFHGANLIVPTDMNGTPVLVNGKIPSYNNIFLSYDKALTDPEKEVWKNALVLDAWTKKYMRFEDWVKNGNWQWVFIDVNDFYANYDSDEILKAAAYNHGCQLGRDLFEEKGGSEILREEYSKWREKEKVIRDEFRRGYKECRNLAGINLSSGPPIQDSFDSTSGSSESLNSADGQINKSSCPPSDPNCFMCGGIPCFKGPECQGTFDKTANMNLACKCPQGEPCKCYCPYYDYRTSKKNQNRGLPQF